MGAVALVPKEKFRCLERFISDSISESDLIDPALKELCQEGFFVSSSQDEYHDVRNLLDYEREKLRYTLVILPHENCNFRCTYCYENFELGRMKPNVVESLKLFIKNNIIGYKTLNVMWFGGEPLLAKDLVYDLSKTFADYCVQNGVNYISGMTTNGYLLTPDVVSELLNSKITGFQVTLDGPEEIHDNNRKLYPGGKTYRKILDNLTKMHERPGEFQVRIRVNFNNKSLPLIEKWFMEEISPLFSKDPRFALSPEYIGKWGGKNDHILDVCDYEKGTSIKSNFLKNSLKLGFSDAVIKGYLMPHGNVCYASKESSIVVGSDGTVYKCTVAFNDSFNKVGKITDNGDLVVNQNWDLWTKLEDKDCTLCNNCSFYPSCQSRKCPKIAIRQKRPVCPMTWQEYETLVRSIADNGYSSKSKHCC
jgi:uncharacterized protein